MAWYKIPVDPTPNQEMDITVEVGDENVPLTMRLNYNTEGSFWHIDVLDGSTGEMLISNMPLLPGEGIATDILRQLGYIGIGSALVIKMTETAEGDWPNDENLGTDYVLVWGTEDEG